MSFKVKDHYFKKAKNENYLARSIYKLEEIDQKYKVLKANNKVCDLGYHPGSWIQYTSKTVGQTGLVVGVDIKPINQELGKYKNVKLYSFDILDSEKAAELFQFAPFDVVLSDMAPNTMGVKLVDQARSLELVEMVFSLLERLINKNGNLVVKVFESADAQNFMKEQKKLFKEMHFLRPKSTRNSSKEYFVIGKGYIGK